MIITSKRQIASIIISAIFTIVLTLTNFAGLYPTSAHADPAPVVISIVPDKEVASPGDTITFYVKLGPVTHLQSLNCKFTVPSGLTYYSGDFGPEIYTDDFRHSGGVSQNFTYGINELGMYFNDFSKDSDLTTVYVEYTVDPDCSGEKTVTFDYIEIKDKDGNNIPYTASPASVNIVPRTVSIPGPAVAKPQEVTESSDDSSTPPAEPENEYSKAVDDANAKLEDTLRQISAYEKAGNKKALDELRKNGITLDNVILNCYGKDTYSLIYKLTKLGVPVKIDFIIDKVKYTTTIPAYTKLDPTSLCDKTGYSGFFNIKHHYGGSERK